MTRVVMSEWLRGRRKVRAFTVKRQCLQDCPDRDAERVNADDRNNVLGDMRRAGDHALQYLHWSDQRGLRGLQQADGRDRRLLGNEFRTTYVGARSASDCRRIRDIAFKPSSILGTPQAVDRSGKFRTAITGGKRLSCGESVRADFKWTTPGRRRSELNQTPLNSPQL